MREKLQLILDGYQELTERLGDPAVIADQKEYTRLAKEHRSRQPLATKAQEYLDAVDRLEQAKHIQSHSTKHVRCGTSFMLMVMIIALLVYSVLPYATIIQFLGVEGRIPELAVTIIVRLMCLPLIAGLAYEIIKWAGNHSDQPIVRTLMAPGMALQKMTTREPDEQMIEVAVAAMQRVIDREKAMAT
ncbi:MAG: DUF1385 domain-containing protein [Actinobacteria bacterium]|nr:DUF1385 domain-containing protein [Actinomycetota bacterium]